MTTDFALHIGRALKRLSNKTATWTPAGGSPTSVEGLFEDESQHIALGLAGVAASGPAFSAQTSDMATVAAGDALTIDAVNYTITDPQKNGATGTVRNILKKA